MKTSANDFPPEVIEASRERLHLASDWEWYVCAADCGDIVWCPPGSGDIPHVQPVCSLACLHKTMEKRAHDPDPAAGV